MVPIGREGLEFHALYCKRFTNFMGNLYLRRIKWIFRFSKCRIPEQDSSSIENHYFPSLSRNHPQEMQLKKKTMFAQFKGNHKNEWHNLSTDVWISVCLQRVFVKLEKDARIVCKLSQRYCVILSRKSRSFPQIRHSFALCSFSYYLVITEKFPIFACHCT